MLFTPLVRAVRLGSLHAFDTALAAGEPDFVKRRIYLTLERGRDLCLRNLLRKVCREQKWESDGKIRKVGLGEFVAAVGVSEGGGKVERDEVECLLANMIYKVCSISPVIYFSLALLCLSLMLGDTAQRCPQVGSLGSILRHHFPHPLLPSNSCIPGASLQHPISHADHPRTTTEPHERLHLPRPRRRRPQQIRRLPRHRHLNPPPRLPPTIRGPNTPSQ